MPHDVFISYPTEDQQIADELVAVVESAGVKCWIASRDIEPGDPWTPAIISAIGACRFCVIVCSSNADGSEHIAREVGQAARLGRKMFPVRIEDVSLGGELGYFLNRLNWLDAFGPARPTAFAKLAAKLKKSIEPEYAALASAEASGGAGALTREDAYRRQNPVLVLLQYALVTVFVVAATLATALLIVTAVTSCGGPPRPGRAAVNPSGKTTAVTSLPTGRASREKYDDSRAASRKIIPLMFTVPR